MAFFYEIRSADNTLLKRDGGFASQDAAKMAAREDARAGGSAFELSGGRSFAVYRRVGGFGSSFF